MYVCMYVHLRDENETMANCFVSVVSWYDSAARCRESSQALEQGSNDQHDDEAALWVRGWCSFTLAIQLHSDLLLV